ncbi:hypothetical protein FB45DRAFT_874443 [Roridomyces roridus]|uniref:Uncharacterized protein n=1 Tax=Roridomyces roridus TaxID=1738132 RepID=A0AAD7FB78_9AGAR|nr:hypothetical protein FB45DRAFT_874443 [Roridomyces roridus]
MSALSSVASQSHAPKKIRKPHHVRASLDEPLSLSYSYDIFDEPSSYSDSDVEDDDEAIPEPTSSPCTSLRREWVALSLRVQFGVFRAKRRIRNMHTIARVTSL